MGKRGPAKKPTAIKMAQGIPGGKHKLPVGEPMPEKAEHIEPPTRLSERGREVFDTLVPILQNADLLTVVDTPTIHRYCDTFEKWLIYGEEVQSLPMIFDPISKTNKPNPAIKAYVQLGAELLKMEKEFGMTPAARASMGTVGGKKVETEKDKAKKMLYGE